MRRIVQLAISERDLRAGVRVLREMLISDHPSVQLYVTRALGDLGKHEALGCAQRMHAALLAEPEPTWWKRVRTAVRQFIQNNIVADYRGNDPI